MEGHQMLANTEVMKHFSIMSKSSVREIMLQHERMFKEQVHDLHKLYNVQRLLMEKAKSMGYPISSTHHMHTLSDAPSKIKQGFRFEDPPRQVNTGALKIGMLGQLPGSEYAVNEQSKSTKNLVRKRKIDLEQLPEDDTDDEMENKAGFATSNITVSIAGSEALKSYPSYGSNVHHVEIAKSSPGNSSVPVYSSQFRQYVKPPLPSYDFIGIKKVVVEDTNSNLENSRHDVAAGIHVRQSSDVSGRETHWFLQGSDASLDLNMASGFMSQRQQKETPLYADKNMQSDASGKSMPVQDASGKSWINRLVEKTSPSSALNSPGRPGGSPRWLMADSHQTEYQIAFTDSTCNGETTNPQENRSLWYSSKPVIEVPKQSICQSKNSQPINQMMWLQASGTPNGAFYVQQMTHGLATDASQLGYNRGLLRLHGDSTANRNVSSLSQKPPLKPVNLALKNQRESSEKASQGRTSAPSNNDSSQDSMKSEQMNLGFQISQNREGKVLNDRLKVSLQSMKAQDVEIGGQIVRKEETKESPERLKLSGYIPPNGSFRITESAFSSWSRTKDLLDKTKT